MASPSATASCLPSGESAKPVTLPKLVTFVRPLPSGRTEYSRH